MVSEGILKAKPIHALPFQNEKIARQSPKKSGTNQKRNQKKKDNYTPVHFLASLVDAMISPRNIFISCARPGTGKKQLINQHRKREDPTPNSSTLFACLIFVWCTEKTLETPPKMKIHLSAFSMGHRGRKMGLGRRERVATGKENKNGGDTKY